MRTLCVSANVPVSAPVALMHFWDLDRLQASWDLITHYQVKYDDGINQECLMSVERDNKQEYIRIIRFRVDGDILFFNPTPPPMMTIHRGAWRFQQSTTGGCVVVAEREYELLRGETETGSVYADRSDQFHSVFQIRLEKLLAAFKRYCDRFIA